ncbi:MAG: OmpA family protein [Candidatus Edwardsbacteria bacterium]|nr:OmpA family protein [Candidatus Edwardsbacteria bacterium]
MKAILTVVIVLVMLLAGSSYYFYFNGRNELEAARNTVTDLTFQVDALEAQRMELERELEAKIAVISLKKEEEIARLKGTYEKLTADMKNEIQQGQIKITQLADRLSVSMVDKILFPSGEAELTPEGIKVLERVGNVLKNTSNKTIRVEGHTDNVPIHPRLQKQYPTNWELSTARAANVVRFLQEKVGIAPERMQVIGLSEYQPVASNKTASGRSKNRRIEITLLPEQDGN